MIEKAVDIAIKERGNLTKNGKDYGNLLLWSYGELNKNFEGTL